MDIVWKALIFPLTDTKVGPIACFVSFLVSAIFLVNVRSRGWIVLYRVLTVLIALPYLYLVGYVLLGLDRARNIDGGFIVFLWTIFFSPIGIGWFAGLMVGMLALQLQRAVTVIDKH